jgi:hypothetical protein
MNEPEVIVKVKAELERILRSIPFIDVIGSNLEISSRDSAFDIAIDIKIDGKLMSILVECKSIGEPRMIRQAIQQVNESIALFKNAYAVIAAPFISSDAANICRQNKVGYLDLAGNCLLSFDRIFIERKNYPNPLIEKRQVRSIFSPKAGRILRVLLNNPRRSWGVLELAKEADVSLGLVSKVKERLLDLDFLVDQKALTLNRPADLLEQWAANYSFRNNKVHDYFTFDDIKQVESKLSQYCSSRQIPCALTLFSGAALVAPFSRYNRGFAYVESGSITQVTESLMLKPVSSGPNFTILEPYDEGIFYANAEIDGMKVVSDIQLYLDLIGFRGRGEESAKFLLEQRIKPKW